MDQAIYELLSPAELNTHYTLFLLQKLRRTIYEISEKFDAQQQSSQKIEMLIPLIKEIEDIRSSILSAKKSLQDILSMKEEIMKQKDVKKFLRAVFIVNLRIANKKLRKCEKIINSFYKQIHSLLPKTDINKYQFQVKLFSYYLTLKKLLNISLVCVTDSKRMIDMQRLLTIRLISYAIQREKIKKGDILLSYKTLPYLKSHLLSFIISIAEKSRITHSAIIYSAVGGHIKIMSATAKTHTLDVFDLNMDKGEMLLVFRPQINVRERKRLNKILDSWYSDLSVNKHKYQFAEFKSWIAVLIGFFYIRITPLIKRSFTIPNLFYKTKGFYCSEFIDYIFKESNIYLTPRSQYSSVVGPYEFLFSPYLKFIGVLYNHKDKDIIDKENFII
ncbi:MAG: hypothetical protein AABX33_04180 [Nanoarchaeota archaeon]